MNEGGLRIFTGGSWYVQRFFTCDQ